MGREGESEYVGVGTTRRNPTNYMVRIRVGSESMHGTEDGSYKRRNLLCVKNKNSESLLCGGFSPDGTGETEGTCGDHEDVARGTKRKELLSVVDCDRL